MCCPLILCRNKIIRGAKGPNTIHGESKRIARLKVEVEEEGMQHRRKDAHEQLKMHGEASSRKKGSQ